jgi:hypothetical protein
MPPPLAPPMRTPNPPADTASAADSSPISDAIRMHLSSLLPKANMELVTPRKLRRKLELLLKTDLSRYKAFITSQIDCFLFDRPAFDSASQGAAERHAEQPLALARAPCSLGISPVCSGKADGGGSLQVGGACAVHANVAPRQVASAPVAGGQAGTALAPTTAAQPAAKKARVGSGMHAGVCACGGKVSGAGLFLPQKRTVKERLHAELSPAQLQEARLMRDAAFPQCSASPP